MDRDPRAAPGSPSEQESVRRTVVQSQCRRPRRRRPLRTLLPRRRNRCPVRRRLGRRDAADMARDGRADHRLHCHETCLRARRPRPARNASDHRRLRPRRPPPLAKTRCSFTITTTVGTTAGHADVSLGNTYTADLDTPLRPDPKGRRPSTGPTGTASCRLGSGRRVGWPNRRRRLPCRANRRACREGRGRWRWGVR